MKRATLTCRNEQRRHRVRARQWNGLDYVEVSDDQLQLTVYFLGLAPDRLTTRNVRITGGTRIRNIQVTDVKICPQVDPEIDNCMVVTVDKPGDFSTYTLCLIDLPDDLRFDPRYTCLDFTFKVNCPSDLDCKETSDCRAEERDEPEINYLAKDFSSFRQLIFDRMALTMPDWNERHVPDLGVTLVELLAYTGDYLSYYQDAVATEAYLDTARQRISVRRHARLVDYFMHEGCNARAWVHVDTDSDGNLDSNAISFVTGLRDALPLGEHLLTWDDLREIPADRYEVFEPLTDKPARIPVYRAHNEIHFYAWGDQECCLPRGATSATLIDGQAHDAEGPSKDDETYPKSEDADQYEQREPHKEYEQHERDTPDDEPLYDRELHLKPGDVLIFEEVVGPKTGDKADADPSHRHAARLTKVVEAEDPLYGQPVLKIAWRDEDALPFPLCVSAIGPAPQCALLENLSVARGNVILVDHGRRIDPDEKLGCVPVESTDQRCLDVELASDPVHLPGRFRPYLGQRPLTFRQPPAVDAPASETLIQDPRLALPEIQLVSYPDPECRSDWPEPADPAPWPSIEWMPRRDLLASDGDDRHFVVEMDQDRRAHLRFGDGELGRLPDAGTAFKAAYRIGNGPAGNVGPEAISHIVTDPDATVSGINLKPRNPLPARGGTAPEPIDEVKLFAPSALRRKLQRAIAADDYARLAEKHPGVQRAAAVLRWNGSWYEVLVAIDPLADAEADETLLREIKGRLYRYRRIGHDLVVRPAHYVPLDIEMLVCVADGFLRGHVEAALKARFSNRLLSDGSRGYFHPDNLSFGDGVFLSKLVATAKAVTGVESVTVKKLERLFEGPNREIENGVLPLGPLEIARVDNDPSFPENGRIRFDMRGGR